MSAQSPNPTPKAPYRPVAEPGRRKAITIGVIGLVMIVLAAFWLHRRLTHIYIDDARVDGEVITISSRVAGWITELPSGEGDEVKKSQLLVSIDDRDARAQRDVLRARVASLEGQMAVLAAQRGQVDEETSGKFQSETNRLASAEADVQAREVDMRQASADLKRNQDLARQKWISEQALEKSRLSSQQAEMSHRRAQADVAAVRGTLSAAGGSRKQLLVIEQQLKVLNRQADEVRAEMRRQELDIADRNIMSPADGKVVMTFVRKGELVSAGQRILMFHDPARIWIEANVKETDIGQIKTGMIAQIHVDAYPDKVFEAKVVRIGQAATSKFALLPDPNPSGNFTKITQRLPVRLQLSDNDQLLRPGMMVEVGIDVRDR
jgi:membrane fusion protein (multidrug efflux system)